VTERDPKLPDALPRLLFEAAPDSYVVLTPELTIVDANPAYLRTVMRRREDIIGRSLFEVFPDTDPSSEGTRNLEASVALVCKTGKPDSLPVQKYDIQAGDGSGRFEEHYWSTVNVPVLDGQGRVAYVLLRVEDVTEFVRLNRQQGEHQRLAAELQDLTGKIEVEIYNRAREVAEASRKLKEANTELESFSYTVSHDLRAPLRALQGFADALQEDYGEQLTEGARGYCARIVGAAQRMEQLIEDLLTYSRLSRSELHSKPLDLDIVVDRAVHALAADMERRGAAIRKRGTFPPVIAHRVTLIHVLQNLLTNAMKFTADGVAPAVSIYAEDRGRNVRLWVEDNGIGVPPEYRGRIFKVFERLHGNAVFPGTGIGLAIVKRGVERMGGEAGIEPGATGGSRFWVELPRASRGPE
jgi:PAS domain S-box-containing protein